MHARERRALQDTLTAIRLKTTVAQAGHALFPNGERHLRPLTTLERIYPAAWLAETIDASPGVALFRSMTLRYEYPEEIVPAGETPTSYLRRLTEDGFAQRFSAAQHFREQRAKVRKQIEHELALIAEQRYEPFFLTVYDVVKFARDKRDSVPGPRLGGQFGGVLLPRHHRGRSVAHGNAVRALHLARAQRAAGHRRRFRASAARGGDPVHLRKVRPRARRADRDGDLLSAALGAARRRQGARPRPEPGRPAGEVDGVVGRSQGAARAAASKPASMPRAR